MSGSPELANRLAGMSRAEQIEHEIVQRRNEANVGVPGAAAKVEALQAELDDLSRTGPSAEPVQSGKAAKDATEVATFVRPVSPEPVMVDEEPEPPAKTRRTK